MKKITLVLLIAISMTFTGCTSRDDIQLKDEGLIVYLSDDDTIEDETYYDYVIIETFEQLESYMASLDLMYSFSISGKLNDYESSYFDDSYLIVCFVIWPQYKSDVRIIDRDIVSDTLEVTVQYTTPLFVMGDATNDLFAVFLEYSKDETIVTDVTVTYVEK